jgi:hypothetical protein
MLWSGSGHGGRKLGTASSEAEIRLRGRPSLKRGEVSPEGVQPSSEAEFHPRGRPSLERGEVSPEEASSPRARQSFGGTTPVPSREAEICPRGAGADRLMGR